MTGRDYRPFVSEQRVGNREIGRPEEADKLLLRMKQGLGSSRYAAPDYEKLKALALDKKIAANRTLIKVNKLAAISKASRENSLLKQHKMVWDKELRKLESARKIAEDEHEDLIQRGTSEESSISMFMLDMEDYTLQLAAQLQEFQQATADPIWTLKEDLQAWLAENGHLVGTDQMGEVLDQHAEICCTIDSVKQQQDRIMSVLNKEQRELEMDLNSSTLNKIFTGAEKFVVEGIPEEAKELSCPHNALKESVLKEFIVLDRRYKGMLKELDKRHEFVRRSDTGEWDPNDHFTFQALVEQHSHDLPNRRTLYMDRLRRQLPHKNRTELVEHEEWVRSHRYYNNHRKTLINTWAKSKQELYNKAEAVFADAFLAEELQRVSLINHQKQQEICQQLYEKIQLWREQKMEAERLEAEIEARKQEKLEKQRIREWEIEQKRRAVDKEKIGEFHTRLEKEQEIAEKANQQRLEELQRLMKVQAEHDQERVSYRKEVVARKLQARQEEIERKLEEEQEKERRLQALRETVQPIVETDPMRILQATQASNAKLGIGIEEDINIQKPLFELKGFSADKVISDPRLKLEQELRRAGLHTNPYAMKLLSQTKPLRPPRKDQESTLLKTPSKLE
ncbi:coiled-coil domain-containing protein 148-like [Amphiura filiformis]|uniref:coiled-coil domain-containing protein 148-like n=1 Tax=Amphiura filiformis TaxID=82378 RepID=UPI003B226152